MEELKKIVIEKMAKACTRQEGIDIDIVLEIGKVLAQLELNEVMKKEHACKCASAPAEKKKVEV